MKTLTIIIAALILSSNVYSRPIRKEKEKTEKTAVATYYRYAVISTRTYFLEVKRLSKATITYKEFLANPDLIHYHGYKKENGLYYKAFHRTEHIEGNGREQRRLLKKFNEEEK